MDVAGTLAPLLRQLLGPHPHVAVGFWDGSSFGPRDAPTHIAVRSPEALQYLVRAPGELGLGRAYVSGALDVEGDLEEVLRLGEGRPRHHLQPHEWAAALAAARRLGLMRPERLPPPPEEARLSGRRHSKQRDAAAISHHYDVGNEFYERVLGPSLTYSCAYFASPDATLEDAQRDKHELICRKLRLRPGERLLDVGCGWGTLAIHAAAEHGAHVVGVTISQSQADLARKRVVEAGVADRVEIRLQDERDVSDGPYDAIASVGMFEHVGAARLGEYFRHLHELLRPQGRLLNHGICRPPGQRARFARRSFINAYVFPDGELHEVGRVVSIMQRSGFEVRDLEGLREHYALTLRRWIQNLEANRDACVATASEGRYRVWRLYMSAAARNFELGRTQIHQILGVRSDRGESGLPLRRADTVLP